jgi:ATP-binding cassette subfamily F protein 3
MALATIDAPHILILDEPTNHLDIESREALVHALNDFPGAVILISHDPHLVETVTDQLWLVRGGRVAPFDGDLGNYRRLLLSERGGKTKGQKAGKRAEKAAELSAKAERPPEPTARKTQGKPSEKADRVLRAEVRAHEKRVAELDGERSETEAALADPALYSQPDAARIEQLTRKLGQIKAELAREEESWLAAQERLEGAV